MADREALQVLQEVRHPIDKVLTKEMMVLETVDKQIMPAAAEESW